MTEQELRQLVREAIARAGVAPVSAEPAAPSHRSHPSFARLNLPAGADTDGPCIVEPAVSCNHCGYCQSYGH